ncbi:MAG TPA: PD-(D/E)XK nuclease family protein, partial [Thermoanaerobaculia bacterium]|nr:PD-(D/E)XK nuclease family protein [Thermoanaerobaculia bacterium]
ASYSKFDIRNLSQSGEPAPSPFFLALFRQTSGRPDADYGTLAAQLEKTAGFVPSRAAALDDSEWWLACLRDAGPAAAAGAGAPIVRAHYPWLADGDTALEARASDAFTIWDGRLRSGAAELDPRRTAEPFSPSRIQALAHCPFAYFLRHVLHVEPPEDLERDPTRWLEPKDEGSLLHEVFRLFFDRITAASEKPDAARHLPVIEEIAAERIDAWRERIPPRSDVAYLAQRDGILVACRTFLAAEAEHCLRVTPRWFEVPFGMTRAVSDAPVASAEPVSIALGRGDRILLRGSIDRVDEAPDGSFEIWDYKTGSAFGVQEGKGLRGGRQAQPALYAMALEALLSRIGREARVSASGYFFPGRKGEGQRMTVPVDAAETVNALERLFDLIAAGMFPHAVSEDDCKFCDFSAICGGAAEASERSKSKLDHTTDTALAAFRDLHDEERQ